LDAWPVLELRVGRRPSQRSEVAARAMRSQWPGARMRRRLPSPPFELLLPEGILHTFRKRGDDCRLLTAIGGAWRSRCPPLFHLRCKFLVRHRNRAPTFTWIPPPHHQFIFRQVLDELIEVAILVLLRVLN